MSDEKAEVMPVEIMVEKKFTGVVKKGKNSFFFYPENEVVNGSDKVDYFHFIKPTLKKSKAHNVVLGNSLSARDMEAMVRASLIRIVKDGGGEILSCNHKEIIENMLMDDVTAMMNECSSFFVPVAE